MIHWPPLCILPLSLPPIFPLVLTKSSFPYMAMARGIAAAIPTATALLLWVVLHLRTAHAATYTVGGSSGWTFNVESWTDGKSFRAGDVLGMSLHLLISLLQSNCFLRVLIFRLLSFQFLCNISVQSECFGEVIVKHPQTHFHFNGLNVGWFLPFIYFTHEFNTHHILLLEILSGKSD